MLILPLIHKLLCCSWKLYSFTNQFSWAGNYIRDIIYPQKMMFTSIIEKDPTWLCGMQCADMRSVCTRLSFPPHYPLPPESMGTKLGISSVSNNVSLSCMSECCLGRLTPFQPTEPTVVGKLKEIGIAPVWFQIYPFVSLEGKHSVFTAVIVVTITF